VLQIEKSETWEAQRIVDLQRQMSRTKFTGRTGNPEIKGGAQKGHGRTNATQQVGGRQALEEAVESQY